MEYTLKILLGFFWYNLVENTRIWRCSMDYIFTLTILYSLQFEMGRIIHQQ